MKWESSFAQKILRGGSAGLPVESLVSLKVFIMPPPLATLSL